MNDRQGGFNYLHHSKSAGYLFPVSTFPSPIALMISSTGTIEEFKLVRFPSRKQAFNSIQVFHGKLSLPRKLKVDTDNVGSRVTYRCVDGDGAVCGFIKSSLGQEKSIGLFCCIGVVI